MYDALGYYFIPQGWLLYMYASRLIARANWEQQFFDFLKPINGSRQLQGIRPEDIIMLKGEGAFQQGTDAHRELVHLLLSFVANFHADNSKIPVCVGYRKHPVLAIDEVVARVLGSRTFMPSLADLKLDPMTRWSSIPALLVRLFRRMAAVGRDEPRVLSAIRVQLADVGYRVARKLPISQMEKSLLLCYGNSGLDDGPGRTAAERKSGDAPRIGIAPHDSDIVHQLWAEVQSLVSPGPFSDFFNVMSNGDKQELILSVAPHTAQLVFHRGFEVSWNAFTEFGFEGSESFDWDRESQLTAARESGVAYNDTEKPVIGTTPLRIGTLASEGLEFSFDELDIQPEVDETAGSLHIDDYTWRDNWVDRRLSSKSNSMGPADYAHSRCLLEKDWGGGKVGMTDLSALHLYDAEGSKPYLGDRVITRSVVKQFKVYIPAGNNNELVARDVNLSVLMKGHGSTEFVPAFTEFAQFPRAVLFRERPDEEALAVMQLGLNREQAKQGMLSIRMTLNYAIVTTMFGENALAIGRDNVLAMARAITSRKKKEA